MGSGKVSIIVPAYNQGGYLDQAIRSGLNQTYNHLELIVVNDGSRDNTEEVARGFDDPRIRYIYQENRGLSAARNTGIRQATGAYYSFLDADDLFLPHKLEREIAVIEADPRVGFVAGLSLFIDEEGKDLGLTGKMTFPEDSTRLLLGNTIAVGSVVVRRDWVERVGLFDESLRACEDWDLWLRLAQAGCVMKGISETVSLYRVHAAQMTRDAQRMRTAMLTVLDKVFQQSDLPDGWRDRRSEAYAAAYIKSAARAYHANLFDMAKQDLATGAQLDPRLVGGKAGPLADALAGWADAPLVQDPLGYLEKVYANLPQGLASLSQNQRAHLSNSALNLAYRNYHQKMPEKARYFILRAARYQPRILANRGILSILVRSFLQ